LARVLSSHSSNFGICHDGSGPIVSHSLVYRDYSASRKLLLCRTRTRHPNGARVAASTKIRPQYYPLNHLYNSSSYRIKRPLYMYSHRVICFTLILIDVFELSSLRNRREPRHSLSAVSNPACKVDLVTKTIRPFPRHDQFIHSWPWSSRSPRSLALSLSSPRP
jgi:hypothetical protein